MTSKSRFSAFLTILLCAQIPLCAATLHFAGTDSTTEVPSVFSQKTLFLNSAEVAAKLRITIRQDSASGMLILCTPQNCVPVYPQDSAEVQYRDSVFYIRTDEIASALNCTVQVKKKKIAYFSCPAGLPTGLVGNQVGQAAPGFRLKADTTTTVSLPDLLRQGPVVAVFFRNGDWDPLSKLLLRMMQVNLDSLRSLGYQVVGVHGYEPKLNSKWAKDLGVQFPLLSDEFSTVMRAYDVFDRGRLAAPSLFAIDRSGIIRLRHIFDLTAPPDFAPILEQLRRIPK